MPHSPAPLGAERSILVTHAAEFLVLALGLLTPRQREVIISHAEGESHEGIGLRLGKSPTAVRFHETAGHRKMRKTFGVFGVHALADLL